MLCRNIYKLAAFLSSRLAHSVTHPICVKTHTFACKSRNKLWTI
jgi:hypothetical protein